MLFRLDEQIGLLLDKLDRDVGRGQYVVGLSSDHGVSPVPEAMKAAGFDAGRIDNPDLKGLLGLPMDADSSRQTDGKHFAWTQIKPKLKELQDLARHNRVEERLAQLKFRLQK